MWLAASDVVVVPGVAQGDDVDTGPVVLMEALAAGRPVVATRMGMAPDVVKNGVNGFLIHSADPNLIVGALRAALADAERLGRGARRTFEDVGGWSRVALDLEKTYQEVLRTSRRRRGDSIVGDDS
jgi:glycosyltransferase involved in cell wall biosynthesis